MVIFMYKGTCVYLLKNKLKNIINILERFIMYSEHFLDINLVNKKLCLEDDRIYFKIK